MSDQHDQDAEAARVEASIRAADARIAAEVAAREDQWARWVAWATPEYADSATGPTITSYACLVCGARTAMQCDCYPKEGPY